MAVMIATPTVPPANVPELSQIFGGLPLQVGFSRSALLVVFLLVIVFFAAMSVIFVYHWRRFPYERNVFEMVENLYFTVSVILLLTSLVGILIF